MGRRGNKQRHKAAPREEGGPEPKRRRVKDAAEAEDTQPPNEPPAAEPTMTTAATTAAVEASTAMPWNRWQRRAAARSEDLRKEHADLAKWKAQGSRNPMFEEYYRAQKLLPDSEWRELTETMARPLPVTFRVSAAHAKGAAFLRRLAAGDFSQVQAWEWRGARLKFTARRVACLPSGVEAWELGVDRAGLKIGRNKVPALAALDKAIFDGVEGGYVSRQEVVSMLPALLLDAAPGHRALDMCAAPGTKTAQLLEAVASSGDGLVVANDAGLEERIPHLRRLMSARQPKELAALVISSGFGEELPHPGFGASADEGFDRVLVDAPCSGDGTMRKAADVLRRWSPQAGMELHPVQVSVLVRGLELLRPGGTLVYSTCSLNPIEDEAVVAEALRRAAGTVELQEVGGRLGTFRTQPGLRAWRVGDVEGRRWRWHTDAAAGQAALRLASGSMWPPTAEEAGRMRLDRCRRVLPHHQNTGGFFLALLRKTAALPGERPRPPGAPPGGAWAPAPQAERQQLGRDLGVALDGRRFWASGDLRVAAADLGALLAAGWPVVDAGAAVRAEGGPSSSFAPGMKRFLLELAGCPEPAPEKRKAASRRRVAAKAGGKKARQAAAAAAGEAVPVAEPEGGAKTPRGKAKRKKRMRAA